MRTENWYGYDIRFVEINGEWWAILKDICDALNLRTNDVAQRLDPVEMIERVRVTEAEPVLNGVTFSSRPNGVRKTHDMLAINEQGIYEALFASRRLEARKFRRWASSIMTKLRKKVGLEGYEVMRMTEPEIQDEIDDILDTLFWDEEKKCVMQSVTVQGGDVEQVKFDI
jgi:prophage antirepressor-like protein